MKKVSENIEFIYKEEFWYISAFLNESIVDSQEKSKELEVYLKSKLHNLKDEDIYRIELKDQIIDLAKNLSLKCRWVP